MILELTEANFAQEVLSSAEPVLVDFWAAWCGPCKMLSPLVDRVAEEYGDKGFKFGKVNVDEQPKLAIDYQVRGIPTLILFRNGQPEKTSVGVVPKQKIEAMLQ